MSIYRCTYSPLSSQQHTFINHEVSERAEKKGWLPWKSHEYYSMFTICAPLLSKCRKNKIFFPGLRIQNVLQPDSDRDDAEIEAENTMETKPEHIIVKVYLR